MRRLLVFAALIAVFSLPARAQVTPKYEMGGGFNYTSLGPQTVTATTATNRLNAFGWNGNGVYNLLRIVGVAFDVSGVYNVQTSSIPNVGNATTQVYPFLIGPRFYPFGHHKLTLFGQLLFGGAYQRLNVPALPPFPPSAVTSTGYAWEGGVGVDYALRGHWSLRLLEVDYLNTYFSGSGAGNERASMGIVYHWGVAGVRRKKK